MILSRFLFGVSLTLLTATNLIAAAQPHSLTVGEGFRDPLGYYDPQPTLSWQLPADSGVAKQTAYRVVAATSLAKLPGNADLWDSGWVESDQSAWAPYGGKPIPPRGVVYWTVQFRDQQNRTSAWGQPARIEMGLIANNDWDAKWIRLKDGNEPALTNLEIVNAWYGVAGDASRQVDVTQKLRDQIARGGYVVTASNTLVGGDPANGVAKQLHIKLERDGKPSTAIVMEGLRTNLLFDASSKFVPQHLRKAFQSGSPVESARLYITSKGMYQGFINGKRVGNDELAPGWTPYHTRIETLTYDVTNLISQGKNAIGVKLGEGWYAGEMMRKQFIYPEAKPALLAQLEITYRDGSRKVILTDDTWRATNDGPVRFSGIYNGETYDAQKEIDGWANADYDDSSWQGAYAEPVEDSPHLTPKRHYPTRITQMLPTVKVTTPKPGVALFDLGQNMVGWPRLTMPVKKGQTVTMRFGEMLLKDGTVYTDNYRSAKSTNHYTPKTDGPIDWRPSFTFHGFRYVQLTGYPVGATPSAEWVSGLVLHSDFPSTGSFESSHAKLNKLQQNIRWGQRGNYLDIPTDCPQRDERLGWTGDAQVFCPTSIFNYGVHSFWASWMQSLREEQSDEGLIPNVVPNTDVGAGSPGWGDVAVVGPWEVYVRTGDRRVLEENYDMMKRWTDAYAREAKDYVVGRNGYGDWLQPYRHTGNSHADTPNNLIATAYYGRCAAFTRNAARVLGKDAEAKHYDETHKRVRSAFSRRFFNKQGKLNTKRETQCGYLLGLGFDLLEPQLIEPATNNLERLVAGEAQGHLRTGFLGTPLLAPELDRRGKIDLAYGVVFKETYPSWFYSINQGATTMWERWNSYSHDKGFGDAGMNSFNHYAYGAIGQWMYERMAGLAPDPAHPGYKHFFVQPQPGGPLTYAKATLDTPYGKAESGWRRDGDRLVVNATVPPNTTATFVLPNGVDGAAKVTLDGQAVELSKSERGLTCPLLPGKHKIFLE